MSQRNIAASVRNRLLKVAKENQKDFNLLVTRYCIERLMYRLSISEYVDRFLLKGALLFDLWFDIPHRPTRDADFLGLGPSDIATIRNTFKEICDIGIKDGVTFKSETVDVKEIRKEANYPGLRVTLLAMIESMRCSIQVDIGFGDAVTPSPEDIEYPTILGEFAAPRLQSYPRYTVVAEKLEALSKLGIANSRMKDYFDLWVLAHHSDFKGDILLKSIQATFIRRQTEIPHEKPFGLTDAFAQDTQKQTQWSAFLRKNSLEALPLKDVVHFLSDFLSPVIQSGGASQPFDLLWKPGGPWLLKIMSNDGGSL